MITPIIEIKKTISPELFTSIKPAAKAGLLAGGEHIKGVIDVYPPARHGPAIWSRDKKKRLKQIRGFFYHLKHGDIEVPYRRGQSARSESLSKRWTVAIVTDTDTEVAVSIGNSASYAPLVHDATQQTRYHALTGWITTQDAKASEEQRVTEMVNDAIAKEIKRING